MLTKCHWYILFLVQLRGRSLFFAKTLHLRYLTGSYIVGNKAKGRMSKLVIQENKTRQISEKRTFLTPGAHTHVCVSDAHIRECIRGKSFFEKSGVLCFLKKFLMVLQSTALSKTNPYSDFIFLFFIEKNNRKSTWKISVAASQSSS